jgi:hypothetical protein
MTGICEGSGQNHPFWYFSSLGTSPALVGSGAFSELLYDSYYSPTFLTASQRGGSWVIWGGWTEQGMRRRSRSLAC